MPCSPDSISIAVIDVETTGLFPFRHDRVVEVAAVVVDVSEGVLREFVSLVNPGRDIGPTRIHGLTSADILDAPSFADVAAHLVRVLEGTAAIAGHNLRFDRQFLESEFSRIGHAFPPCLGLCTMQLAGGGRLSACCQDYGVPFEGDAHCALIDARATAHLLVSLLADSPNAMQELVDRPPIPWPAVPPSTKPLLTRQTSRERQAQPPTFLQRLVERLASTPSHGDFEGAALAYSALLEQVIEDRRIDEHEGEALLETAQRWGMSRAEVELVHRCYVDRLAAAAVADGVVSDAERRDLQMVCHLLGDTGREMDTILNEAIAKGRVANEDTSASLPAVQNLAGKNVCFTGEMSCSHCGELITRQAAEQLATEAGLRVVDSVTKKLDILVVSDPNTQSGKAQKAQRYGIRILHEPVFWSAIGVEVQ